LITRIASDNFVSSTPALLAAWSAGRTASGVADGSASRRVISA
jgi:hypothetical protein